VHQVGFYYTDVSRCRVNKTLKKNEQYYSVIFEMDREKFHKTPKMGNSIVTSLKW